MPTIDARCPTVLFPFFLYGQLCSSFLCELGKTTPPLWSYQEAVCERVRPRARIEDDHCLGGVDGHHLESGQPREEVGVAQPHLENHLEGKRVRLSENPLKKRCTEKGSQGQRLAVWWTE
jgi:hypothetical protein